MLACDSNEYHTDFASIQQNGLLAKTARKDPTNAPALCYADADNRVDKRLDLVVHGLLVVHGQGLIPGSTWSAGSTWSGVDTWWYMVRGCYLVVHGQVLLPGSTWSVVQ